MGTADIVPGVSGGTMAYILGIWQRLMQAIAAIDLAWIMRCLRLDFSAIFAPHIRFLLALFAGIGAAVLVFTQVTPLPTLLRDHPEQVYGLFFGLIVGSIVLLLSEMGRLHIRDALFLNIGILAGWLLVSSGAVATPDHPIVFFLVGMVAISAMLLPGVSGAFILLILGKYATVLDAIAQFDLALLLPFIAGMAVGALTFARAASWLLNRFYRQSVSTITGILTGS